MGLWNKLFGNGRDNDQIEVTATLVDLETLANDSDHLELLEMELTSTKNALDIADKETDVLAARLAKTEKALFYLHLLSAPRPVFAVNRELEDLIGDIGLRLSVTDQNKTIDLLDEVAKLRCQQRAAEKGTQ